MNSTETKTNYVAWGFPVLPSMTVEQIAEALATTPIDGRYSKDVLSLRDICSEYALMRDRADFQMRYLLHLDTMDILPASLKDGSREVLKGIIAAFSLEDFMAIKEIEKKTQHDVEAVKQWVKNKLLASDIPNKDQLVGFIHFALTSADPDTTVRAYALSRMKKLCLQRYGEVLNELRELAHTYADAPMLGRTHGQPALPTTFGKEIAVYVYRLSEQIDALRAHRLQSKLGGAIGNMSAHYATYPAKDWRSFAKVFLAKEYDLSYAPCTTQIEPYDSHAELFHLIVRTNNILIDFCADMWRYISDDWVKQKVVESEVGSSAMPQKVNPIKFENAEGNFEMSVMLLTGLANKLTRSRLQRDLTDSTVIRNVSIPIAWTLIGCTSLIAGLKRIGPDRKHMREVLMANWSVLAEPIQTIMRTYGVADAYDQLKQATRGRQITQEDVIYFIDNLQAPSIGKQALSHLKNELRALSPDTYLGDAVRMAHEC